MNLVCNNNYRCDSYYALANSCTQCVILLYNNVVGPACRLLRAYHSFTIHNYSGLTSMIEKLQYYKIINSIIILCYSFTVLKSFQILHKEKEMKIK